jgi:hypothetical protein
MKTTQNKSTFTPGPWICDDYYNLGSSPEIRMNGIRIARMLPASGITPSESEQLANARLIAAAPALLDACKQAVCGNMGWQGIVGYAITLAEKGA